MPQYRTIPTDAECYSTVAQPGDKAFCVTIEEMVLCGVTDTTLKAYISRHRSERLSCWPHHKEGKSVYLHYIGLMESYQTAIRSVLMNGMDVDDWYNENGRFEDLKKLFKPRLNEVLATEGYKEGIGYLKGFAYTDGSAISRDALERYRTVLQWLIFMVRHRDKKEVKTLGYSSVSEFYTDVTYVMRKEDVKVPYAYPRLTAKIREFEKIGAPCLIDNRTGNDSALKITDEAGNWLIARMASPIKGYTLSSLLAEYNRTAPEKGWKFIKATETLRLFLYRPDIKPKWYGARYGELKSKEKYTRINKLNNASCRDALWYSDGTKLNLYYLDENGKMATCQVYEVMDAFSEVFLGYHFSNTEDFEAQYYAFRMAIKQAGHKPFEVKFDNQGGHKKLNEGGFFKKLAMHAIPTQPYNGKSKTIEHAFGRLQSYFMHEMWFFTGQNMTATRVQSRANMEFILEPHNQKRLPTLAEAKKAYLECRMKWNTAPHPRTGVARMDMYRQSVNPKSPAVDIFELVDMFWIFTEKAVTFTNAGLTISIKKQKYTYEVFDADGNPSKEFYRDNIGRKFIVAYDPDLPEYAKFYVKDATGSLKFVTDAGIYLTANRAMQDQTDADKKLLRGVEWMNKELRKERASETDNLMRNEGVHPEQFGLKMPKLKGVEKKKRKQAVDVKETPPVLTIGGFDKAVSNHDEYINEKFYH